MPSVHSAALPRSVTGLLVWRLAGPLIAVSSALLWIALATAFRHVF